MVCGLGGQNIYYRPYKSEITPSPTPPTPIFLVGTQEYLLPLSFPYFTSASTSPLHTTAVLQNSTFITRRGHISCYPMSLTTSAGLLHLYLEIEASVGVALAVSIAVVPSSSLLYPDDNDPGGIPPSSPRCQRYLILTLNPTSIPILNLKQPFSGWEDIPKTNPCSSPWRYPRVSWPHTDCPFSPSTACTWTSPSQGRGKSWWGDYMPQLAIIDCSWSDGGTIWQSITPGSLRPWRRRRWSPLRCRSCRPQRIWRSCYSCPGIVCPRWKSGEGYVPWTERHTRIVTGCSSCALLHHLPPSPLRLYRCCHNNIHHQPRPGGGGRDASARSLPPDTYPS